MKSLLLAFVCTLTPSAVAAETIVIPVQDMLFAPTLMMPLTLI